VSPTVKKRRLHHTSSGAGTAAGDRRSAGVRVADTTDEEGHTSGTSPGSGSESVRGGGRECGTRLVSRSGSIGASWKLLVDHSLARRGASCVATAGEGAVVTMSVATTRIGNCSDYKRRRQSRKVERKAISIKSDDRGRFS
jgi:hypothetical protein